MHRWLKTINKITIRYSQGEKAADFTLVPPAGELCETHASSLISAHSLHYVATRRHPQNRKYITYCIAVIGGTSQLVKFGYVVFEICERTCRQTYMQRYRHADHNTSHP